MIETKQLTQRAQAHVQARDVLYVLIACEESQAECQAFRALGHIAFSCDIQECRKTANPAWHIHGDALPYIRGGVQFTTQDGISHKVPKWDLIICHPPCTYLCKVGAVHLVRRTEAGTYINKKRWQQMIDAARFFRKCLNAKATYVAVENPIPMKRAGLPRPSFFLCPSWFGVKYTKKTLYWVKNLPPIMAEIEYPNPKEFVRNSRGKYRSRTFPQVAQALSRQWSQFILDDMQRVRNF